ncbi:hypothetical protein CWI75_18145 [Kineobactrum sediminis]|uniref:Ice-binding protein C-terminal domain-containing protein n=1 Tax=Kineobactrum sediminis TaxID=1905677 RepID=A0A2N5XXW8_9GAMM|nr:PEP-CTERM sorting domain-containing protein [Kineobactrum sediminis]PLW80949.1 hypothetical protein CWI75_18145 [Kineobactrum sediminis]
MKLTKRKYFNSKILAAAALALPLQAAAVILPPSNEMTTIQYGDFVAYSLDLIEQCAAAGDPRCLPSSGEIPANAGFTKTQLTILTGENGDPQTTNQPEPLPDDTPADNAFASPSGNQSTTFEMGSTLSPEPTPDFTADGDLDGTWEIQIGALRKYLDNNDLVFIFDNAQQGDAENQWLQIWAQAIIYDPFGDDQGCFEFHLSTDPGCPAGGPVPPTDAFNPGSYVTAFTSYCVNKDTGATFFDPDATTGTSSNYCDNNNGYYVNGNIGSADADNAVFSRTLNDQIFAASTGDDWILSLDVRTANNNGGAETLWICDNCRIDPQITSIPAPGSVALFGAALLGLVAIRRRRP